MFECRIEGLPPSYNKHFQIAWGLREMWLSPEAHAFKNRVKINMPPAEFDPNKLLAIEITYSYNFYYKNKKLRKFDTANCDKLLLDAISERLGIDDSLFKTRIVNDIHNDKESYTLVKIYPL